VYFSFSGDPAIGDGVTRHFFATIMSKLQHGLEMKCGKWIFSLADGWFSAIRLTTDLCTYPETT